MTRKNKFIVFNSSEKMSDALNETMHYLKENNYQSSDDRKFCNIKNKKECIYLNENTDKNELLVTFDNGAET